MAKRTIEKFYSDLSGNEIDHDSPTISFSFDGSSYEIDLTTSERKELESAMARYVETARRVTGTPRTRAARNGPDPKTVRAWAVEQNVDVPARGRIPATILEAYRAAH